MKLTVGIIGLPNAGKSTLFNALLQRKLAQTAVFPFTTIEPNRGMVEVPDENLPKLAKILGSAKTTPASIELVDIAGLIKNAHQGEGLGNQFLGHIREVKVILHVVRAFEREDVPHIHEKINPAEDVEIIKTELALSDIESLERQLEKLGQDLKGQPDNKEFKIKLQVGEQLLKRLNQGPGSGDSPAGEAGYPKSVVTSFNLLTTKPTLYVINVSESDLGHEDRSAKIRRQLASCKDLVFTSAKLEADLTDLPWTERQQYLKSLGVKESVLQQVILRAYQMLNLLTFYTGNRNETRGWTLPYGSTALDAAATVHTDFANKFIKAEVIQAKKLIEVGNWNTARQKGLIGTEGREYKVVNKDVLLFRAGQ